MRDGVLLLRLLLLMEGVESRVSCILFDIMI